MDSDAVRLLEKRHFTYCVGLGIVVAITSQMAERTDYNKLLFGISIGALVVNLAAAMWAFTPTRVFEDNREFCVFKTVFYSTGFVSPYAAACVLISEKFAPYLVATMSLTCVVITLFNFYDLIKSNATATDDQVLPTTNAALTPEYHYATARIAAAEEEEEQNLGGGSGLSPNLPWRTATVKENWNMIIQCDEAACITLCLQLLKYPFPFGKDEFMPSSCVGLDARLGVSASSFSAECMLPSCAGKGLLGRHYNGVRGRWDNLLAVISAGSSMPLLPKDVYVRRHFDSLKAVQSGLGMLQLLYYNQKIVYSCSAGSSMPLIPKDLREDSLKAVQSGLGTAAVVEAIARISYFYEHESCGQYTPFREGTG
ncbi:NADH dehydrogenase [ubiquinone] flavoprotein 1, mitochondrial [Tanacetum coccineum]